MLSASIVVLLLSAQAETPPVPTAAPAKPAKVCKTIKITGSRLAARRMCATKAEWERVEREAQEELRNSQPHSKQGGNG